MHNDTVRFIVVPPYLYNVEMRLELRHILKSARRWLTAGQLMGSLALRWTRRAPNMAKAAVSGFWGVLPLITQ